MQRMPATLEHTTADTTTTEERSQGNCDELIRNSCAAHSRSSSAGGSSDSSQPTSPRDASSKGRVSRSYTVRKPKSSETTYRDYSVGEQTQLLLKKMFYLEQKLQLMETELKTERERRLTLEVKVTKLEEDNERLKKNKALASQQLHDFAEKFFAHSDTVKGSPLCSPHPSLSELRTSRSSSVSSNSYDPKSRLSGISM